MISQDLAHGIASIIISPYLQPTLLRSPGSGYVPDEPVASSHSANFDGVAEAPVGRHQRRLTAVQRQDGLLGEQVIEANGSLLLCYH